MTSHVAFDRIYAKVVRAEQHINDFQLGLRAYFDTNPYGIAVKEDTNGGLANYIVSKVDTPPDTLALIAADVVNNLRTALDNLAYQLVLDSRNGTKPDWKVYFPISKTATDYKGTRSGCIKGLRKEIVDAFDASEPYKGGNGHGLWQLNEFGNLEKHRIPLGAGVYYRNFDVSGSLEHDMSKIPGFERIRIPPILLRPANPMLRLKLGDIIMRAPGQPEVAQNYRFTFDVSIDAPEVIEPEPAIVTLKNLSNLVGGTLNAFRQFF